MNLLFPKHHNKMVLPKRINSYIHIPIDERDKLDAKARNCILLGYGAQTTEYHLYYPVQLRNVHSRDLIFNEVTGGIETAIKKEPPWYH
uniref:Retroviral polymerase SH3-like domain-containing protein n=1 Tax=Amphimedon queenslandica TaxID=400682 RepID=A0A1X7VAY8_AMPQE